ncbi:MAG: Usp protein [Campylobacterota bacterium]|nr:Usp protein [Campylobacterota bacterium]
MKDLKTLVAIDFSDDSIKVLEKAIDFTKDFNGKVDVVHIVENSFFLPKKDLSYIKEHGLKKLNEQFSDINEENFHCINGKIKNDIGKSAELLNSDVVIMGKSGETFLLGDMVMGSHTKDIVKSSPVPIIVVKNDHKLEYKDILVLTDCSKNSAEAIKKIATFFPNSNIKLVNFYLIPFEKRLNSYGFEQIDLIEYNLSLKEESQNILDRFVESLQLPQNINISAKVRKSSLNPKLFEKEVADVDYDFVALHTTANVSFYALDILENAKTDVFIVKV